MDASNLLKIIVIYYYFFHLFRQNTIKLNSCVCIVPVLWHQKFSFEDYIQTYSSELKLLCCAWIHLIFGIFLLAPLRFRRSRTTWSRVMWPLCWSTQWCWCVSCAPRRSNTAVSSQWVRSAFAGSQITRATLWWCVALTVKLAASFTTTLPTRTVCIVKFWHYS